MAKAQAKLAAKHGIRLDKVVAELASLAFANMGDYVRLTSEGEPAIDLSTVTQEQMEAILELTVEDFTEGRGEDKREVRRVRIKLWNKRAALIDLGRHLGRFTARTEFTGKDGGPIEMRRAELETAIFKLLAEKASAAI